MAYDALISQQKKYSKPKKNKIYYCFEWQKSKKNQNANKHFSQLN